MGFPIEVLLTLIIGVIEIISFIYLKIKGLQTNYYFALKILFLLTVIVFWYPYTVMSGWLVGTFNFYTTILITVIIVYLLSSLNNLLRPRYKNWIQILVSLFLLIFSAYWFIKIPPYEIYTIGHPYQDIILQDTRNYILTFSVYTITLLFFLIQLIKSRKK